MRPIIVPNFEDLREVQFIPKQDICSQLSGMTIREFHLSKTNFRNYDINSFISAITLMGSCMSSINGEPERESKSLSLLKLPDRLDGATENTPPKSDSPKKASSKSEGKREPTVVIDWSIDQHNVPGLPYDKLTILNGYINNLANLLQSYETLVIRKANDRLSIGLSKIFIALSGSYDVGAFHESLGKLSKETLNKLVDLLIPQNSKDKIRIGLLSFNEKIKSKALIELFDHISPYLIRDRSLTLRNSMERHEKLKLVIETICIDPSSTAFRDKALTFVRLIDDYLRRDLNYLANVKRLIESKLIEERRAGIKVVDSNNPDKIDKAPRKIPLHRRFDKSYQNSDFISDATEQIVIERIIGTLQTQTSEIKIQLNSGKWPAQGIQGIPLITYGELLGNLLELERQLRQAKNMLCYKFAGNYYS